MTSDNCGYWVVLQRQSVPGEYVVYEGENSDDGQQLEIMEPSLIMRSSVAVDPVRALEQAADILGLPDRRALFLVGLGLFDYSDE
jgi:hypothetical protein